MPSRRKFFAVFACVAVALIVLTCAPGSPELHQFWRVRAAGVTASMTLANSPPSVSSVKVNNNSSIVLTAGTLTNVSVTATVTDLNGCNELTTGTTTVLLYRSGVGSSSCLGNQSGLNCYRLTAFTTSSACSGVATSFNTTTTFQLQYYAQATDASSSYNGQNWMATVYFTDPGGATSSADSTNASSSADVLTLVGLSINTSTIDYGTLGAGTDTSSTNDKITVSNAGNSSTTLSLSGTALTSGSNIIATSSQHYATSSFTFGGNEQQLSGAVTTVQGFTALPPFIQGTTSKNWTSTQALPSVYELHAAAAYNGYIYKLGGANTAVVATTSVLFAKANATGSLGTWTSTVALPTTTRDLSSVAYNGFLYAVGGLVPGGPTSTVNMSTINSNGSIGTWTSTKAMLMSDVDFGLAAYNNYLYAYGGEANGNGTTFITSTVLFAPINNDGTIGTWASSTPMAIQDFIFGAAAYNGYLYAVGGSADGVNATSTVIYAPLNATGSVGAWTSTTALPVGWSGAPLIAYNNYMYLIGGSAQTTGRTSTILFAPINSTGSIGSWSTMSSSLPVSFIDLSAAVTQSGYLYLVGGEGPGTSTPVVATSTVYFAWLGTDDTFWGVSAPSNAQGGAYTGTVTFTAVYSQ